MTSGPLMHLVRSAVRTLASGARQRACDVAALLGPSGITALRYTGELANGPPEPLTLVYVGREQFTGEFDAYLGADATQRILPSAVLWRGSLLESPFARRRLLPGWRAGADVLVQELMPGDGGSTGDGLLHLPALDGLLAVAPSFEEQVRRVRSKAHRRRLRKAARSAGLTWRVSEDARDFGLFYDTLHAPFVRRRFGLRAHLDAREALLALFRSKQGRILLVSEGEQVVCGTLLLVGAPGVLTYHRNGFAEGTERAPLLLADRTAALEVGLLRHAQEGGFAHIDFGYTRAVLSTGLFTHKRRLGCAFMPSRHSPAFRVWVRPERRHTVFARFPMLAGAPGEFVAHVGYEHGAPERTVRQWRSVLKNYPFPGLKAVRLYSRVGAEHAGRAAFETALRDVLSRTPIGVLQEPLA